MGAGLRGHVYVGALRMSQTILRSQASPQLATHRPRLLHTYPVPNPVPGSVAMCGYVKRTPAGDWLRNGHDGRCVVCAALSGQP